jgi:hypothetical protein
MKVALYNWNCVLNDVIDRMRGKHILMKDYKDADVVVLWNEIEHAGWKERVVNSQKMGKKVVLYQLGVWGADRVRPPFNEPILSDIVAVWGQGDRERLISYGVPKEKIHITGSPLLEHLKPKESHEGKNVVFCLEHWDSDGDVIENNIVAAELRKLKGVKVITKGLEGENDGNIFDNFIGTNRFASNHMAVVADVLSTADVVVAISESTFALLAEVMDIPVIIPDVWIPKPRQGDDTYLKFEKNYSNAVTKVKLEDLNKEIYRQLKHPEILREERKQAGIDNAGVGIEDPVGQLIKVIENAK